MVARATGLSRATIARGLAELDADVRLPADRVRQPGGGRKRATTHHPTLLRKTRPPGVADRMARCSVGDDGSARRVALNVLIDE